MKKLLIIINIFVCLCGIIYIQSIRINKLNEQFKNAHNNASSLIINNFKLDSSCRTLKMTIDQLEYLNDSISQALLNVIDENKLDKTKIKQLQYYVSTNSKTDTIKFIDTVFVNNIDIDTLIADNKWYSLNVKLKSPDIFVINPQFINENIISLAYKKETINPPKKFFLFRWFQKKHIVTEIKVINNNPYSSVDTTRFIEIIKR